jgi:molybdopterin synthase catalytic subunit
MATRTHTRLSANPLSLADAHAYTEDAGAGATVVFTGQVRDHSEGRQVVGLSYEAYEARAREQLETLVADACARWPSLCALWIEHRVGRLDIGDPAVVVAASAPHRADAFDAARWSIDTLKQRVAIWKQEHWAAGDAHWPGTD